MRLCSRWETSDGHSSSNNKRREPADVHNNATIDFIAMPGPFVMPATDVLARMRTNNRRCHARPNN